MSKLVNIESYIANKKKAPKTISSNSMSTGDVMDWVNEDLDKLAKKLDITRQEAYEIAQGFFNTYPALSSYVSEPSFRKEHPISHNE